MKNYFLFLISFLIVFFAKCIPFSFIVGSQGAFFSGTTSTSMVIARHGNFWMWLLFLLPMKNLSIVELLLFLGNRAPLFFAAWSYRASTIFSSVIIPLICFVLFLAHPIGIQAWPYTLYWLIPICIYLLGYKNIFLNALGAVFVAHAVGSVLWIYTHQMDPEVWLSLIPIVATERLLMVFGVIASEYCVHILRTFNSKIKLFYNRKFA